MKDFIRRIRVYIIRLIARIHSSELNVQGKILIIAPHPDDEVIGCSGLIQQSLHNGNQVFICILTGGEGSHRQCCTISENELKKQRRKLAIDINRKLGVPESNLFLLNFPDGSINMKNQETLQLHKLIEEIAPDNIFIPHQKGEGWPDHIEAGNIIRKLIQNTSIHIYEYCVWFWYYNVWSLDWKHSFLIRMDSCEHQRKLKAIHDYVTPLAPCGKPYSGVLPKVFVRANQWNKELYFIVK